MRSRSGVLVVVDSSNGNISGCQLCRVRGLQWVTGQERERAGSHGETVGDFDPPVREGRGPP